MAIRAPDGANKQSNNHMSLRFFISFRMKSVLLIFVFLTVLSLTGADLGLFQSILKVIMILC